MKKVVKEMGMKETYYTGNGRDLVYGLPYTNDIAIHFFSFGFLSFLLPLLFFANVFSNRFCYAFKMNVSTSTEQKKEEDNRYLVTAVERRLLY